MFDQIGTNIDSDRLVVAEDEEALEEYQPEDKNINVALVEDIPESDPAGWRRTEPADGVVVYERSMDDPQNQQTDSQGGESRMADDYFNRQIESLADRLEDVDELSDEVTETARMYEQQFDDVAEAAEQLIDHYRGAGIDVTEEVGNWAEDQIDRLGDANDALYGVGRRLAELDRDYVSNDDYGGVDISPLEDLNN